MGCSPLCACGSVRRASRLFIYKCSPEFLKATLTDSVREKEAFNSALTAAVKIYRPFITDKSKHVRLKGMQSAKPGHSDMGYLPSVYSTLPNLSAPEMSMSKGHPPSGSQHLPGGSMSSSSWERRCLRKHRRTDDEGCSAKRRKLMEVTVSDPSEYTSPNACQSWSVESTPHSPSTQLSPSALEPAPRSQESSLSFSALPLPTARPETEGSCMEVEAAQRKLQEIEDRITLEDDSDEDLDVEPAQRRPVLVLSDSLREGLQRGIGDILPHTVAQSVSRSCMELVIWRPPEDPLTQQLKDSLQKQQRKQHTVCRQTSTPIPRTSLPEQLQPKESAEQVFSTLYSPPAASSSGVEDMEL